jgi:2-oxoglutarate ferredoxin oxidoreductase subunit alpha
MTKIRAEKVKRVQNYIPEIKAEFADSGDLLVIGWGGTYGSLHSAVKQINHDGYKNIGFAHFNYINPLPKNTEALFKRFKKILVCELNNGQFVNILRMNFNGFEFLQFNKIQGLPFGNNELIDEFKKLVK